MAHEFEIARDVEVDASPEQVWEAIATGPGWDSWFMGRNEIEPGEGGRVRWSIGGAFFALPIAATIQAFLSTYSRAYEVVDSHLTRVDHPPGETPTRGRRRWGHRSMSEVATEDAPPSPGAGNAPG